MIRVYDDAGKVIATHDHKKRAKEQGTEEAHEKTLTVDRVRQTANGVPHLTHGAF